VTSINPDDQMPTIRVAQGKLARVEFPGGSVLINTTLGDTALVIQGDGTTDMALLDANPDTMDAALYIDFFQHEDGES